MYSQHASRAYRRIQMDRDQVLVLKGRRFEFTCLAGLVWLTDGVGGERFIKNGQQAKLAAKGKICIQAFVPSVLQIQRQPLIKPGDLLAASAVAESVNCSFLDGCDQSKFQDLVGLLRSFRPFGPLGLYRKLQRP
jgi:hypothetical protein